MGGNSPGALHDVCAEEKSNIAGDRSHFPRVGVSCFDGTVDCACFVGEYVSIITSANHNFLITKITNEDVIDCMGVAYIDVAGVCNTCQGEGELEDRFCSKLLGWEMRSVDRYLGIVGDAIEVVIL